MTTCGRVVIEDFVEIGAGCMIDRGVSGDTLIGAGSKLDNMVHIGHDTTILSAYLMVSDYYETIEDIQHAQQHGLPQLGVGNRSYMQNVIVDKNVRIGDDVRIIGGLHLQDHDTPLYTVKEGIIVIKKGAVLPNGFSLGA